MRGFSLLSCNTQVTFIFMILYSSVFHDHHYILSTTERKKIVQLESSVEQSKACVPFIQSFTGIETFAVPFKCFLSNGRSASSILIYWIAHNNCIDLALCHRSNFNPCCVVYKILFLKPSYVSLMCKCRLVLTNKYRGLY